jgi:hypothetical protein
MNEKQNAAWEIWNSMRTDTAGEAALVKSCCKSLKRKHGKGENAVAASGSLRVCSNCGFLRSIDRKNPDSRTLLEPAR